MDDLLGLADDAVWISSAQVGMSWIRPWIWPADQMPALVVADLVDAAAAAPGHQLADVLERRARAPPWPPPGSRSTFFATRLVLCMVPEDQVRGAFVVARRSAA